VRQHAASVVCWTLPMGTCMGGLQNATTGVQKLHDHSIPSPAEGGWTCRIYAFVETLFTFLREMGKFDSHVITLFTGSSRASGAARRTPSLTDDAASLERWPRGRWTRAFDPQQGVAYNFIVWIDGTAEKFQGLFADLGA